MANMQNVLRQRKEKASELLERIEKLKSVNGIGKLHRKIDAENDFLLSLEKLAWDDKGLDHHLSSSNLSYLEAVLTTSENSRNSRDIMKRFVYSSSEGTFSEVIVDVIGNNGNLWVKVFARNPYAIHRIWDGLGQYGDRDVCMLANEFQAAAEQNIVDFKIPKVVFLFAAGVTKSVADALDNMAVQVIGKRIDDPDTQKKGNSSKIDLYFDDVVYGLRHDLKLPDSNQDNKVNLDVTTLIALVSSITNGHCNFEFEDEALNMQAKQEREEPLLPTLKSFLKGKDLYVCQTALNAFKKIVSVIGGEKESAAAYELLQKIRVVEDSPSQQALDLSKSTHIKERSKIIFGTGDTLQATTVTANVSFIRAAHNQGVTFSTYLHSSRALSEKKEIGAKIYQPIEVH